MDQPKERKPTEVSPPPPALAVVTITMNLHTGEINVNGPLGEKGLCYQMLELARDLVKDYRKPGADLLPPGVIPMPARMGRA